MTARNLLLKAKDSYNRGWCIIPIPYGKKAASIKWKQFQQKRPDENQIYRWFGTNKIANIAVVLGEVSGGLTCLDFDDMFTYEQWK